MNFHRDPEEWRAVSREQFEETVARYNVIRDNWYDGDVYRERRGEKVVNIGFRTLLNEHYLHKDFAGEAL